MAAIQYPQDEHIQDELVQDRLDEEIAQVKSERKFDLIPSNYEEFELLLNCVKKTLGDRKGKPKVEYTHKGWWDRLQSTQIESVLDLMPSSSNEPLNLPYGYDILLSLSLLIGPYQTEILTAALGGKNKALFLIRDVIRCVLEPTVNFEMRHHLPSDIYIKILGYQIDIKTDISKELSLLIPLTIQLYDKDSKCRNPRKITREMLLAVDRIREAKYNYFNCIEKSDIEPCWFPHEELSRYYLTLGQKAQHPISTFEQFLIQASPVLSETEILDTVTYLNKELNDLFVPYIDNDQKMNKKWYAWDLKMSSWKQYQFQTKIEKLRRIKQDADLYGVVMLDGLLYFDTQSKQLFVRGRFRLTGKSIHPSILNGLSESDPSLRAQVISRADSTLNMVFSGTEKEWCIGFN